MPRQRNLVEVVHSGTPEGTVADRKPGRLDEVGFDSQAGGEAQHRAGVLGDIGLEQRDSHDSKPAHCRRPPGSAETIINWYKSPAVAALAGLRSAGKGANKPTRWSGATCSHERRFPRVRGLGLLLSRASLWGLCWGRALKQGSPRGRAGSKRKGWKQ